MNDERLLKLRDMTWRIFQKRRAWASWSLLRTVSRTEAHTENSKSGRKMREILRHLRKSLSGGLRMTNGLCRDSLLLMAAQCRNALPERHYPTSDTQFLLLR